MVIFSIDITEHDQPIALYLYQEGGAPELEKNLTRT